MQFQILASLLFFQVFTSSPLTQKTDLTPAANIIFKSIDGGETWQDVSAGLPKGLQVSCVSAGQGEVFLGTGNGFYRSSAHSVVPVWGKEFALEESILGIYPGQSGFFVRNMEGEVFKEMLPGSGVWNLIGDNLENKSVYTILETSDGLIWAGCQSGILKSADGGQHWQQVFSGGAITNLVETNGVLIGGGSEGLLRSDDGGLSWNWMLKEDAPIWQLERIGERIASISNPNGAWTLPPNSMANKLRVSADGGKTWQRLDGQLSLVRFNNDLMERPSSVRFIKDIQQAGEYLFCNLDSGIFRSSDGGMSWKLIFAASEDKSFKLAVSGRDIYVVSVMGGC